MENFVYYTPTKVFFGKGGENEVGRIIKDYGFKKILLHYGGGSIKKSGLYDRMISSLKSAGVDYIEMGGVEPNPKVGLVREGIQLCRAEGVELVLAVGGGSVIDSAKAIGMGVKLDGDIWDVYEKKVMPTECLPIGAVLTIAAAGSEMSDSAVISNSEAKLKRGHSNNVVRPLFAVMNPELTYTVSQYQTACGICDIMMHTLERYFTNTPGVELTDQIGEGLLRAVIAAGEIAYNDPENYDARADLMWASSLSHNGLTGDGRTSDFASHRIEHEISAIYDNVAHGAGLAVVFPAWCKFVYKHDLQRFARYAEQVWGITDGSPEEKALKAIQASEDYFKKLSLPVRLSELGIGDENLQSMAEKAVVLGNGVLGNYVKLSSGDILEILKLCL